MNIKDPSIDHTLKPEVYFDYGCEGGGETLYRQKNEHGKYIYYTSGSSGGFLDEDEDPFKTWNRSYEDFAAFWQYFTQDGSWFYLTPIFIHLEIQAFVEEQINELSGKYEDRKDHWKYKLTARSFMK